MPAPTFSTDDYDPIARRTELADQGLPNYCLAEVIGADGQEHYALLRYSIGECDCWPDNWSLVAPHEVVDQLPVYWKD